VIPKQPDKMTELRPVYISWRAFTLMGFNIPMYHKW